MTKAKAKKDCLLGWNYLKDHPEIEFKCDLPPDLYSIFSEYANDCPLCEYIFYTRNKLYTWKNIRESENSCDGCPLHEYTLPFFFSYGECYWYEKWKHATSDKERQVTASKIVETVKKW